MQDNVSCHEAVSALVLKWNSTYLALFVSGSNRIVRLVLSEDDVDDDEDALELEVVLKPPQFEALKLD